MSAQCKRWIFSFECEGLVFSKGLNTKTLIAFTDVIYR